MNLVEKETVRCDPPQPVRATAISPGTTWYCTPAAPLFIALYLIGGGLTGCWNTSASTFSPHPPFERVRKKEKKATAP